MDTASHVLELFELLERRGLPALTVDRYAAAAQIASRMDAAGVRPGHRHFDAALHHLTTVTLLELVGERELVAA